jgi:predicted transcriptional regulator
MEQTKENHSSHLTIEQKNILNNVKNKDIAKILGISVNRVSTYKSRNKTTSGLPKAPILWNVQRLLRISSPLDQRRKQRYIV